MPFKTVLVDRVEKDSTADFWRIWPVGADCRWDAFTTNSAWKASVCEQGRRQRRQAVIGWRETRHWGKDIVMVELEKEPVTS